MKKTINHFLQKYELGKLNDWIDLLANIIDVILIAIIAWVISIIVRKLIVMIEKRMIASTSVEDKKRVNTLSRVFRYISSIIITAIAVISILGELGVSVAPLLATAGVAGIAVGFGAQSLVKDYFTGFVMLMENQIRQGDIIEVAGKSGIVEEVTLRYVRLRDYEGAVHYVPNSSISVVTNRTRNFAYAVTDISVSYQSDLDKVYAVMNEVAEQMRQSVEFQTKIQDKLEIAGVESLSDSAIVIRSRIKVSAQYQGQIRREFQELLKKAFDKHQIEIPYKHLVIKSP
jgi:small-conductance mechanosensitive channel